MSAHWDSPRIRFAAALVLLIVLAYLTVVNAPVIWSVLGIAVLVLFLALALNPFVRLFIAFGLPRWAAAVVVIVIMLLLVAAVLWFVLPPLFAQFQQFIAGLPAYWGNYLRWIEGVIARNPALNAFGDIRQLPYRFVNEIVSLASILRTAFTTTIGVITTGVLVLVVTLYSLIAPWPLLLGLRGLFPKAWWGTIDSLSSAIALKIQAWLLGTAALAVLIGVLDYIALALINAAFRADIPFIFLFATLGGLLEIVPILGPLIAMILPATVALTIDPYMALAVLAAYLLIQQLENNIASPLIMHRAVSLHPVSVIFSLVVMSGLFGAFGALIAVPTAATVKVIYDQWYYPLTHHHEQPLPAPDPRDEEVQVRRAARERWAAWRARLRERRAPR